MSKVFFQVNKGLSLFNQSSAPSDPTNGDQYYDSTLNTMRFYINGTWFPLGTVDSVGLSAPSIFTVSGSPVTSSGTLTFSLNTQVANTVFSGPVSGSSATPTFRGLVSSDMALATTNVQSSNSYTVVTGDYGKVLIMTSAAARTVTLPTAPANNYFITVKDGSASAQTNAITVTAGGTDVIESGGSSSISINSQNQSLSFVYVSSSGIWYVI